jgi:hypothetical protein
VALVVIWWFGENRAGCQRILLALIAGLGALAVLLAFAIVFHHAGALATFVDCYVVFNSIYSQQLTVGQSVLDLARRAMVTLATVGILRLRLIAVVLALSVAAVAPMGLVGVKEWATTHRRSLIIPLWFLVEFGLLASNGGFPYHAFPILCPVALGATWLVVAPSQLPHLLGRACSLLVLFLLVGRLALASAMTHPPTENVLRRNSDWTYLVNVVREATPPSERVLVLTWDGTFIMNLIHRHSITRYIHTVPLITRGYASDEHWVELLGDIEMDPPEVILVSVFTEDTPPDAATALGWSLRWFFRWPYDNTPYPHRVQFEAYIEEHYSLDRCLLKMCLFRREADRLMRVNDAAATASWSGQTGRRA